RAFFNTSRDKLSDYIFWALKFVYENLFKGLDPQAFNTILAEKEKRRKSMLDYILTDANSLRTQLGPIDTQRFDQYLTELRELEKKLDEQEEQIQIACSENPLGNAYVNQLNDIKGWGASSNSGSIHYRGQNSNTEQ